MNGWIKLILKLSDFYHISLRQKYILLLPIETIKKYRLSIIGVIIGGLLGYLYYAQVGCVTGTCAITSSPVNSTVYGAILGYLVLGLFKKDKTEKT